MTESFNQKINFTSNMMSVPAINPVLPSSGNQPSKVGSGPAPGSVSPIGLTVPQKMSVIPPQISPSSNKPSLSINHSSGPLSLVHENKISGVQAQASLAKASDKPKDLSPTKPTSNGVETAAKASPTQASQGQGQGSANTTVKTDEKQGEQQQPVANHSDVAKQETPVIETPQQEEKSNASQTQNSSQENAQSVNQSESGSSTEEKMNADAPAPSTESGAEAKPVKSDVKSTSGPNKRKKEQKPDEKKSDDPIPEKKPQRIRSQVLPYQSPLPELATFINKSLKEKDASQKSSDEKLIVFYKNEFLAVRNAENGFYLCQTLQNVYRTSHRIRIRWLSQDKDSNTVYTPDFYDFTDFECILTTVALEKLDKNKYKLPEIELERTENILKRALDVEKGVSEKPSVTEEHPDGIDLSIYKDESQLQKAKKRKSTSSTSKKSPKQPKKTEKDEPENEEGDEDDEGATSAEDAKKKKSKVRTKSTKRAPKSAKTKAKTAKKGKSQTSGGREKSTKSVDQLKVSPPNEKARVVAKVLRKVDMTPASSNKSKSKGKATKSNSKKTEKKNTKSEKLTTSSRSSERRGSTTTSRKKAGKK